jgi:hypothetical protein
MRCYKRTHLNIHSLYLQSVFHVYFPDPEKFSTFMLPHSMYTNTVKKVVVYRWYLQSYYTTHKTIHAHLFQYYNVYSNSNSPRKCTIFDKFHCLYTIVLCHAPYSEVSTPWHTLPYHVYIYLILHESVKYLVLSHYNIISNVRNPCFEGAHSERNLICMRKIPVTITIVISI